MAPTFGAVLSQGGTRFTVPARSARVDVVLHDGAAAGAHPLARSGEGVFETWIRGVGAGDRYGYLLDGAGPWPDPASRFQPEGVHGPSQVVDPAAFQWSDQRWAGRPVRDLVVYELHVGTFSLEGTFAGVTARLPYLRDLGVTAIELMPVAAFAGRRNWGYDGAALFAPSQQYGTPDDLRRLVDTAHQHGLSVLLDVVYNHLGPEGAYLTLFEPGYLTTRHETPWGGAVDLAARGVRRFIVDNAVHWVREYHLDGLRLDATHAFVDENRTHIVHDIADAVRSAAGRPIVLHAEDHRNLAEMVEDRPMGGWGLDGVWADDFHHVIQTMTAGDTHGYYADFAGHTRELATVFEDGWLYSGEHSRHFDRPRGTRPARVPMYRFVICAQNHDQVGNRALGDRLHHSIGAEVWRAVSVVLLTAPMTPLLFMGQEWAASSPFQYFTDLEPGLGRNVTEGRRREFADFPGFDAGVRPVVPDPQADATFAASRLRWDEQATGVHRRTLALYRALLALRLRHPALGGDVRTAGSAVSPDDETIVVERADDDERFLVVARFKSGGQVNLEAAAAVLGSPLPADPLEVVLDTEHGEFVEAPAAIDYSGPTVRFQRAGAIILRVR